MDQVITDLHSPTPVGTGTVQAHNIFDPLPDFMRRADCVFVDPPYNLALLNGFYSKAGRSDKQGEFTPFMDRVFECIAELKPHSAFIEIGKECLADFIIRTRPLFKYVTFYNSSYFHDPDNKCYIIHGTNDHGFRLLAGRAKLDHKDEADIIAWITAEYPYNCIADLCMGKGLTGFYANKAGRQFVGIELNPERLAVLGERIAKGKL